MSTVAVGAYLQVLRESRKMSRAALAERVKASENTIWRIESGRQEPGGVLLISMTEEIQGSLDDIKALVCKKNASAEYGKQLAEKRIRALDGEIRESPTSYHLPASQDEILEAISHALELQNNRSLMGRLIDFGKQLLEEKP
jgi:transcriptional regulator with XRE-family HTH domain